VRVHPLLHAVDRVYVMKFDPLWRPMAAAEQLPPPPPEMDMC
jgi:hypothetical protein